MAGCSSWLRTGNVPLSCTPRTNEKSFSVAADEVSLAAAAAQPAEARAARKFPLGLERRSDDLAVEVDDRVEHGGQRAAGLAAEAGGRAHIGELPGARSGSARRCPCSPCTAATGVPAKNAPTAASAQPLKSLPSTECPVIRDDQQLRVGDRAPRLPCAPEVGVRRSWAPERISVGTFGSAPAAWRRRRRQARTRRRARGCSSARCSCRRGRSRELGSPCSEARASERRVAAEAGRCHGNGVSSQEVVTNSALFSSSRPSVRLPRCAVSPARSARTRPRASTGAAAVRGRV